MEIRRLQRSLATTSVYVTHDQMEAMTLADRLVVLNGGRIEQVGTPIELYERPASTFVATFIGSPSMNLLKRQSGEGSGWALSETAGIAGNVDTVGIRPEDIVIADVAAPSDFKGQVRVDAVELVGAESYVYGSFANGETVVFRVPGRSGIAVGATIAISAGRAAIHAFDAAGKRRAA